MSEGAAPEGRAAEALRPLRERRSIRRFTDAKVPRQVLRELVRYATLAPSACNRQAWRFVVVTDPEVKQRIVDGGGSVLIAKAPCGILVSYANTTRNTEYRDEVQSASACIQNLLLAAHAYGLGACWLCTLPRKGHLRRLLGIPPSYSPVAYIILGYPSAATVKEVPRLHSVEELVGENRFPAAAAEPGPGRLSLAVQRALVWVYRRLPGVLRRRFANRFVDRRLTKKFDN
ncbi:MAG: nitroreductase family protein [Candidatus Brocadiia bacterium]